MHPSLLFTSNLLFLYYCFSLISSIANQASFPACSCPSLIHTDKIQPTILPTFSFCLPKSTLLFIYLLSLSLSPPLHLPSKITFLSGLTLPLLFFPFFFLKYHSLSEFILAHLRPQTPTCKLLIWCSQPLEASGFWWASVISGLHWPIYAY
ncbi:hypothetical protein TorRG33x02_250570 [Trema orientale]|uniref:Uncharacterized protein n=1 Tax=Trema orientale TaxID=63057 RepID=A0A2P5DIF0_TREOI|nr:hypothetical protein TorRG33x02_250570 [Trema orientale]